MIVKTVPNRRDGKSSFKDLAKYMTEGIEQSGEAPTTTSWGNLTQYVTAQSVLNALGNKVEKTRKDDLRAFVAVFSQSRDSL